MPLWPIRSFIDQPQKITCTKSGTLGSAHTLYCRFFLFFSGGMGTGSLILYSKNRAPKVQLKFPGWMFIAIAGDELHILSVGQCLGMLPDSRVTTRKIP